MMTTVTCKCGRIHAIIRYTGPPKGETAKTFNCKCGQTHAIPPEVRTMTTHPATRTPEQNLAFHTGRPSEVGKRIADLIRSSGIPATPAAIAEQIATAPLAFKVADGKRVPIYASISPGLTRIARAVMLGTGRSIAIRRAALKELGLVERNER